jgi:SAM-dependent methyltransferase
MQDNNLFYRIYDDLFATKDYDREIDCALELGLKTKSDKARILEIGAGTGSHSIACAKRGLQVTAVEIDPHRVDILNGKLNAASSDIRSLITVFAEPVETLEGKFDMAMAMFNVINYISSTDALKSFMTGVANCLPSGNDFIFDAWNGNAVVLDPPAGKTRDIETDDSIIHMDLSTETDFDRMEAVLIYKIEVTSKRDQTKEEAIQRIPHKIWSPDILTEIAAEAGLTPLIVHPLNDTSRKADDNDWKIMFHCRRD